MTKKLVLFDVDHTLLDSGDSHKRVFQSAFKKVLGKDISYENWTYHGYTDLQIIHSYLNSLGLSPDKSTIDKIKEVMIEDFKKQDLSHSSLMEGVRKLLEELKSREDIILGLVTGNLSEIAYLKLSHFKLQDYFSFGGFGSLSVVRSQLVVDAINKAKKISPINNEDIFVIGDTVNDVKAASDVGVNIIAVATGSYSIEALKQANPHHLFPSLKETKKIIDVITDG